MKKGGGEENIQLIIDNFADKIKNKESNDALKMVRDADENPNIASSSFCGPLSKLFANILNADKKSPKINFMSLFNEDRVEDVDFVLPVKNGKVAQNRFANSLVGFFVGKRVAFSLVQNYVMYTWSKFGFQKVMRGDDDVFYFKFNYVMGLEQVLGQGPWMIRNQPLFLTKWAPNLELSKDKVSKVPVWVKIHKVSVVSYCEDELSLIASQIGKPVMLDAFTSDMCNEPWGRISYARALIKISKNTDLKKVVTMAVPIIDGEGYTKERIVVEYEWKSPRCIDCHVFGHDSLECPKHVVEECPEKQPNKASTSTSNLDENVTREDIMQQVKTKTATDESQRHKYVEDDIHMMKLKNSFDSLIEADKVMHSCIHFKADNKDMFCSWIYAHSRYQQRRILWQTLQTHKAYVRGRPWCLLGDFNVSLSIDDKSTGTSYVDTAMRDFQECVEDLEITDVNSSGLHFTWNQKPSGMDRILKKIDRIMANLEVSNVFARASAFFHPYRTLDHTLAILRIPMISPTRPKTFKFANILLKQPRLKEIVLNEWQNDIIELDDVQLALDSDPSNYELRKEEAAYLNAFNEASRVEERFLQQKAKVDLLKLGDANTAYFHKLVPPAFLDHYMVFLGQRDSRCYFSMGDDRSPGPDGYSTAFFKEVWDIVAQYVIKAVLEFFVNGVLLKELNHAIIALIPKQNYLEPYKGLSNELGPPRYAFKVDIQKAYDTVDWDFLRGVLTGFGFHARMIGWIMECLRQGDPMSPYLFTLVMEILTLMLHRRVRESDMFTYHRHYSKLNIINLCFADDLFLFTHGDAYSAQVIMDTLEEFKIDFGLTPSLPKSTAYFCNVLNYVKIDILGILPFEEGKLPVKYLGVPLVPSRLVYRDCTELLERVKKRICDWKNKSLSIAGREQLIRLGDGSKSSNGLIIGSLSVLLLMLYRNRNIYEAGFNLSAKNSIRPRSNEIRWHNLVWFPQNIPRHAIHAWLVIKRKLKTQDSLKQWDVGSQTDLNLLRCPLCNLQPDTHDHLFFTCNFTAQVWNHLKPYMRVSNMPSSLDLIVEFLEPMFNKKSARSIIVKLVFKDSCYLIWKERNDRWFAQKNRSPD
ncbi:hypothetical protein Tco_1363430 [Tanacetum coccineum]